MAWCLSEIYLSKDKTNVMYHTDKKKIKFSSYIRKFRVEQLQSHICLTASSYMGKYLHVSSYMRKPFLMYDIATAPLWISLHMRKILFLFYQCNGGGGLWSLLKIKKRQSHLCLFFTNNTIYCIWTLCRRKYVGRHVTTTYKCFKHQKG